MVEQKKEEEDEMRKMREGVERETVRWQQKNNNLLAPRQREWLNIS